MILIHQIDTESPAFNRELWLRASMPCDGDNPTEVAQRDLAVLKLFARGAYRMTAAVQGDLEYAFAATQNGVHSPSWSMMPPPHVTVSGPGHTFHDIPVERAARDRADAERYGSPKDREIDAKRAGLTTVVTKDGQEYERQPFGYASTQVGDVFRDTETNTVYVCAMFGFDAIA